MRRSDSPADVGGVRLHVAAKKFGTCRLHPVESFIYTEAAGGLFHFSRRHRWSEGRIAYEFAEP